MKMLKTKKKIIVLEYRNDLLIYRYVYIFEKFGLFLVLPKKKIIILKWGIDIVNIYKKSKKEKKYIIIIIKHIDTRAPKV